MRMRISMLISVWCLWLLIAIHLISSAMETAISDIQKLLQSMSDEQKVIIQRLEKVESGQISDRDSQTPNNGISSSAAFGGVRPRAVNNAAGPQSIPDPSDPAGAVGNSPQVNYNTSAGMNSIQDEYLAIKDKVSNVKIPQEFRVSQSKSGIKK